jgi:hypothetical protein
LGEGAWVTPWGINMQNKQQLKPEDFGDPARIIRNPVNSIIYWIPDNRYAISGMTKRD